MALQWPALRSEGFRYRPIARLPRSRAAADSAHDGPGHARRRRGNINVLVNTYLAPAEPGAVSWLGYAFRLMYLPIGIFGVSIATAALSDLSRHAAAEDMAALRRIGVERAAHDADAERAGDGRAARAGRADRRAALSARQLHTCRHHRHGSGADVLRARPARLLGGEDRVADLLLARRQPHAGRGLGPSVARESRAQHHPGPRDGLQGSRARDGDRRDLQCLTLLLAAARTCRRARRQAPRGGVDQDLDRLPRSWEPWRCSVAHALERWLPGDGEWRRRCASARPSAPRSSRWSPSHACCGSKSSPRRLNRVLRRIVPGRR